MPAQSLERLQRKRIGRALRENVRCERAGHHLDSIFFSIIGKEEQMYLVNADLDGGVECSCLDSEHRGDYLLCKHICWLLLRAGLSPDDLLELRGIPSRREVELLLRAGPRLCTSHV